MLLADKPLSVIDDDTVIVSSVVGLKVGMGDGSGVGMTVGMGDGSGLGMVVGTGNGSGVGTAVGMDVGGVLTVGTGEGAPLISPADVWKTPLTPAPPLKLSPEEWGVVVYFEGSGF